MINKIIHFFRICILFIFLPYCISILSVDNVYSFELFKFGPSVHPQLKQKLSKFKYPKLNTAEINMLRKSKDGVINGRQVFYNDSLFKNNTKDAFGVNNCMRMESGKAPIAHDGIEVSLHHLHQRNNGIIVEVDTTFHRKFSNDLHSYKNTSEIDRQSFDIWRKGYWKERWSMRCK